MRRLFKKRKKEKKEKKEERKGETRKKFLKESDTMKMEWERER